MLKTTIVTLAIIASSVVLNAQSEKFQVYGFMDGRISKTVFMNDNSLFKLYNQTDNVTASVDHINLYFDINPNPKTRALMEFGYQSTPVYQDPGSVGQILTTVTPAGSKDTTLRVVRKTATNSVVNLGDNAFEKKEFGSVSVERAWLEYQHNQYLNLRFGKFITPAGIWNVDHGSPAILTIHQPFETGFIPVFPKSQIGLLEHGSLFLSEIEANYELYLSTGRDQISIEKASDIAVGGHLTVGMPVVDGLSLGISGFTGMQKQSLTTQSISVNISDKVLAFRNQAIQELVASGVTPTTQLVTDLTNAKVVKWTKTQEFQARVVDPENCDYVTTQTVKARDNVFGADLRFNARNFTLQSEINYQWLENQLTNGDPTTLLGFYFLGSYNIRKIKNFTITPYVMFENVVADNADENPQFYLAGATFGRDSAIIKGFQTYSAGLNFKILANLTVKLEYVYADVLSRGIATNYKDIMDTHLLNAQFSLAF